MTESVERLLAVTAAKGLDASRATLVLNGGLELAINYVNQSTHRSVALSKEGIDRVISAEMPANLTGMRALEAAGGQAVWRLSTRLCCTHADGVPLPMRAWLPGAEGHSKCENKGQTKVADVEERVRAANAVVERSLTGKDWANRSATGVDLSGPFPLLDAWAVTGGGPHRDGQEKEKEKQQPPWQPQPQPQRFKTHKESCELYDDWVHSVSMAIDVIHVWLAEVLQCRCEKYGSVQ